ncbi:hypothetical protein J2Z79_002006 [Symbiobacterium terraclitae]|uniref:Regulator of ribonuclease activity B domain-containing protein n=1 Tax=Symbiobacterium terraclitae TaxID=557451 RepID=A0ABS4JUF6_9FIRM|nr:hypothetical protein [Symbiobacterium terraclitae]
MRPESDAERAARHAATVAAYRALVDHGGPPREPLVLEQHFFTGEAGDIDGLTAALTERGFRVESLSYDPGSTDRTWRLVVVRLELLDEVRLLALSDELDALARQFDGVYDGWLTHGDQ